MHDHFAKALQDERAELLELAASLRKLRPEITALLEAAGARLAEGMSSDVAPAAQERALDTYARELRATWLRAVAAETSFVLRSPTQEESNRLSRRHDSYGYERDFDPASIEAKLAGHEAPQPWRSEHLLFSSAQAALTTALLTLQDSAAGKVALLGAYFETRALLDMFPCLRPGEWAARPEEAHVVVAEPITCDGRFSQTDIGALARTLLPRTTRALIVDATLSGHDDGIARALTHLSPDIVLIRIVSGLKLMQAGLELANVGIMTIYAQGDQTERICDRLRQARTLSGAGLRFADALALEAPWFTDAAYARRYQDAVFANNAALIRAVADENTTFDDLTHPALSAPHASAPYCVFRLRDETSSLESIAQRIEREAKQRDLVFERGGSFGFRGHRYDVVCPASGEPPFLRVAMGRRAGWSRDGVTELICDIARDDTASE